MKIVIAPDSFKDSLSASDVASAIELGLREVFPDAELVKCPMADGGEGTVEAILAAVAGERRKSLVTGPLGTIVEARWGWLPELGTAIIEMAEASGLQLVPVDQRNACISTTKGTGELILEFFLSGVYENLGPLAKHQFLNLYKTPHVTLVNLTREDFVYLSTVMENDFVSGLRGHAGSRRAVVLE